MWLDVQRFVHPIREQLYGYEAEAGFQRLFFVIRYGWILLLILALVLAVQSLLLQPDETPSEARPVSH